MASLVAFSPDAALLAVADGALLRVWDVATNELRLQQPADLSNPVSCFAWEPSVEPVQGGKKKKKRRSTKAGPSPCSLLLVGSASGQARLLSVASGEQTTLAKHHKQRISSCAWASNSNSEYWTACEGKLVTEWKAGAPKKRHRSWKCKEVVTAMCHVGPSEACSHARLVVAGPQIYVYNLSGDVPAVMQRVTGHEHPISFLRATPTSHLVSAVASEDGDVLCNVWRLGGEDRVSQPDVKTALASLAAPAAPATLELTPNSQDKDWRCVVVGSDAKAYVFDCAAKASRRPLKPNSRIQIETGDMPSVGVPIFAAMFDPRRPRTQVIVARGSPVAPSFERVEYTAEKTGALLDVALLRAAGTANGNLLTPHQPTATPASKAADVEILGHADVIRKRKRVDTPAQTLQEKVAALELGKGPGKEGEAQAGKAKPASGGPTTGSLANFLVQALQSNDNSLLEECINNTNEDTVRNTVRRLPSKYVLPFLLSVVNKVQAKPSRGLMLIVWVKMVLGTHTSYLMTLPDVAQRLAPLYSLVDARVAVFPRLLSLTGRMDLVMSQISSKGAGVNQPDEEQGPSQEAAVSYQDDDSDDDLDDDQEEEPALTAEQVWGSDDEGMNGVEGASDSEEEEEKDEDEDMD